MTISKYPSDVTGKSSGQCKMHYQVLVLLQDICKATQSNHAGMSACSSRSHQSPMAESPVEGHLTGDAEIFYCHHASLQIESRKIPLHRT